MKELLEKMEKQNLMISDYDIIIKIIEASVQRGAIRAEELTTVGKLYDKVILMIKKMKKPYVTIYIFRDIITLYP